MSGVPGASYCCEICGAHPPTWTILRCGDAVITWSCQDHLHEIFLGLQRDHEVTELVVKYSPKAREWAEIGAMLRKVGDD